MQKEIFRYIILERQNPWNLEDKLTAGKVKDKLIISIIKKKKDELHTSDFKETAKTIINNFFLEDGNSTNDNHYFRNRGEKLL